MSPAHSVSPYLFDFLAHLSTISNLFFTSSLQIFYQTEPLKKSFLLIPSEEINDTNFMTTIKG